MKQWIAVFNQCNNRVANLNNCTIDFEHLSFSTTLRLNKYLNQELNPWFKPLPILNQQQPTSLEIYSRFELLRISTTPWTWTISDLNHSQHRFNNNTTTLELSSQMSHSEFEQLPELRLQLPVNLNRSLIEQHPLVWNFFLTLKLLWVWTTPRTYITTLSNKPISN